MDTAERPSSSSYVRPAPQKLLGNRITNQAPQSFSRLFSFNIGTPKLRVLSN